MQVADADYKDLAFATLTPDTLPPATCNVQLVIETHVSP